MEEDIQMLVLFNIIYSKVYWKHSNFIIGIKNPVENEFTLFFWVKIVSNVPGHYIFEHHEPMLEIWDDLIK